MDYKFQINLRGIIDLLSQHLYSGPQVYLRELMQNGVDAIRARSYVDTDHKGEIQMEVVSPRNGRPATLVFTDNGVGLTEEEIHRFLATIGQTSKKADMWDRPTDFIGQFGVGLLACFIVSEEIVVITRSAKGEHPTMEWRGRPDGTYTIKKLEHNFEPGTQVYLTCKKGSESFFEPERVRELAAHYGSLLPYPIRVSSGGVNQVINSDPPPWRQSFASRDDQVEALKAYGQRVFEMDFFDAIPLKCETGGIDGVAYVLPFSPSIATRRTHRVYLKNMLLAEDMEGLLPDWAFFVKCVVNANGLRPTASREGFYEDETLASTREALGDTLRGYLIGLARKDPTRLQRLIALHALSIKALAVQDDEFYRLFIDWLPFETSMGEMTLGEYRKSNPVVRYVSQLDHFRQIARVAAAQNQCIINGGYVHNAELLEKYDQVFPDAHCEKVDPSSLTQSFEDLTLTEREKVFDLVQTADRVLQPFHCSAEIKKFQPQTLPALYSTDAEADFLRSVEQSRSMADPLWASVLGNLSEQAQIRKGTQLCLNYLNPLIRKLAGVKQEALLERCIQMLYLQSLLMGHRPLSVKEMRLLNEGLLGLIECGVGDVGEK